MWLERAFKGEDVYVFNFCAAFVSSLQKEEISWSFFQSLLSNISQNWELQLLT